MSDRTICAINCCGRRRHRDVHRLKQLDVNEFRGTHFFVGLHEWSSERRHGRSAWKLALDKRAKAAPVCRRALPDSLSPGCEDRRKSGVAARMHTWGATAGHRVHVYHALILRTEGAAPARPAHACAPSSRGPVRGPGVIGSDFSKTTATLCYTSTHVCLVLADRLDAHSVRARDQSRWDEHRVGRRFKDSGLSSLILWQEKSVGHSFRIATSARDWTRVSPHLVASAGLRKLVCGCQTCHPSLGLSVVFTASVYGIAAGRPRRVRKITVLYGHMSRAAALPLAGVRQSKRRSARRGSNGVGGEPPRE